MSLIYVLCPILAWFFTGILKFIINFFFNGKNAFKLVGLGGFPSNHTSILSATLALISLREGLESPVVGLGLGLLMIVIFDAMSLRNQVGLHAKLLNKLQRSDQPEPLRERVGHKPVEIIGGIIWGATFAMVYHFIFMEFFA